MTQTRFDLNVAIEDWRRELSAQRNLPPEARRELDGHLQDSFAELRRRGLNEAESFWLARKRMGEPQLLNQQFKIAMKTTLYHRSLPVAIAAWAIFVVSFFLPAFDRMPGWQCAILQIAFWPQALQGQWLSVHYLLLTLANLLMLVSPFLLARAGQDARYLKWLRGLGLAAAVLVWSFLLELVGNKNGTDLKIGCYLWATSFGLLFLASLLQTTVQKCVKQTV
jgi:hypothetical protein